MKTSKPMNALSKITVAILVIGVINSCSYRNYHIPSTPVSSRDSFKTTNWRFKVADPVADWWNKFDDSDLDSLINNALSHNLDVAVAIANVQKARAKMREKGFKLYPIVHANGSYTRKQQSKESGLPVPNRNYGLVDVGLNASWSLDLFGRISQEKKAAKAKYQASFAELHGAYVSVASEVALTYMQLRGAQYRLKVARQNVQSQKKTFELTKTLYQAGSGSKLDVARARSQLELTRSTIPPLKARIKGAINRLSVLTGNSPNTLQNWLEEPKPLPSIPPTVDMGKPSDLLRRRPDIRRTERLLAASMAHYNVQVSNYFPHISIGGSLGFVATSFADLFTGGALAFGLGPKISWAAFDLGRVKASVHAADAKTKARLAIYKRTVLQALEDVSTSMSKFRREEKRRRDLTIAAQAAAKAEELARQRYRAGLINLLDVLDAQQRLLKAQSRLAKSNIKTATYLIDIYRSLGGGWQVKTNNIAEK